MFWEGFEKRAAKVSLGIKSLRSGAVGGNKPTPLVSTVGATKANPLPTMVQHPTEQISAPNINTSDTIKKPPMPKKKKGVVGEVRI